MMKNSWVKYLESHDICFSDLDGNMPCDNGAICDKCQSEEIQRDYEAKENIREMKNSGNSIISAIRKRRPYVSGKDARREEKLLLNIKDMMKKI